MSTTSLSHHEHGKGRVRVLKVGRTTESHHAIPMQMSVQVIVHGKDNVAQSFYSGDNSSVLPTDSIKNTIYALSKSSDFSSIEDFGKIVATYFVSRPYSNEIHKAVVTIVQEQWTRIENLDSTGVKKPHAHAFVVKDGTEIRSTVVEAIGHSNGDKPSLTICSGLSGLKILKTTQSSFTNFLKDKYTTLPEVSDRLVSSIVKATWTYESNDRTDLDYNGQAKKIRDTLLSTFAGPSDIGSPSPAVQYTLYQMGTAVLANCLEVKDITLNMPNVHNLPLDQSKFGLKNIHPHGEIFVPVDEPHGIIEATINRRTTIQSRL